MKKMKEIDRSNKEVISKICEMEMEYKCEDTDLSLIGKAIDEEKEAKKRATIKLQATVSIIGLLSIGVAWWVQNK